MIKKSSNYAYNKKYADDYEKKMEHLKVRVPEGEKDKIKEHANKYDGGSMNAFITRAISEQMERDKGE